MSRLIKKKTQKGMVLILAFIIITTLTAIVVAFIYLTSTQLKGSGYDTASHKALWLAEAGIEKAIYYLDNGDALLGANGTTAGITENIDPTDASKGSYTIVVTKTGAVRTITSTGTWGGLSRTITRTAEVYDTAADPYYQTGYGVAVKIWEE